jgi:hypothetical protein
LPRLSRTSRPTISIMAVMIWFLVGLGLGFEVPPGGVAPSYRTSPKNQLRASTAQR